MSESIKPFTLPTSKEAAARVIQELPKIPPELWSAACIAKAMRGVAHAQHWVASDLLDLREDVGRSLAFYERASEFEAATQRSIADLSRRINAMGELIDAIHERLDKCDAALDKARTVFLEVRTLVKGPQDGQEVTSEEDDEASQDEVV